MKNKVTILFAILLVLTVGFGCSFIQKSTTSSDNSSNSANPNDSAKTGVAECDELLELINNDQKNPDDNFVTRKIREYAIDFAKETIKKNIEENKGDKQKIADGCKKAKGDYLKNKEEKKNEKPKDTEKDKSTQKS
jgi:hypothetical protein